MARMMADCRRFPSESECSLTIIGDEDEVVRAAVGHAVAVHGHQDNPELWEMTRASLEPASEYATERAPAETFPG